MNLTTEGQKDVKLGFLRKSGETERVSRVPAYLQPSIAQKSSRGSPFSAQIDARSRPFGASLLKNVLVSCMGPSNFGRVHADPVTTLGTCMPNDSTPIRT